MNFRKRATDRHRSLFYLLAFIWYLRAWIHAAQFGYYLLWQRSVFGRVFWTHVSTFVSRWRLKKARQ